MPKKPPGRPFVPGDPRAGRPQGRQNNSTVEVRTLARSLITDHEYVAALKKRLIDGKAGDLELQLWLYSYGPPSKNSQLSLDSIFDDPVLGGL